MTPSSNTPSQSALEGSSLSSQPRTPWSRFSFPAKVLGAVVAGSMVLGLLVGGSHPAAAHLVSAPWDKVLHFATWLVLGFNIFAATRSYTWTLVLGGLIGAVDEIHQLFVPGRSSGVDDWLADMLGTVVACFVVRKLYARWFARAMPGPRAS